MSGIQIIDPTTHPNWDDLLLTNAHAGFFHTAGWARVLMESYGYRPLYFAQTERGSLTGLLAVMEVNSLLTGKRGVSLPFTDHCPVVAEDSNQFRALLDQCLDYGRTAGWKTFELRGGQRYLSDTPPSESFLTHDLALDAPEKEILNSFRNSTRRNIQKAARQNISVQRLQNRESVKAFYSLNCLTRKDHGLPPQPSFFFDNIHRHVISKKKGFVVVGSFKGKAIAASVFFQHRDRALYKYGASDKKYQRLRANNLVMWHAIQACAAGGSKHFNFGRTEFAHTGLLQFKRGWGAAETPIHYYQYNFSKADFVKGSGRVKSSYAVFKHMPMLLLNLTGRLLYRHVG